MIDQQQSFIMSKEKFRTFVLVLGKIANFCNDLHIVDGNIMQRTNGETAIIRCDLSSLFQIRGSFIFSSVKEVKKNLSILRKDSPIRFKLLDNELIIKDTEISLNFTIGPENFCDNKRISEDEFNKIFEFGAALIESDFRAEMCKSISKICEINNYACVKLRIASNRANLSLRRNDGCMSQNFKLVNKLPGDMHDCKLNLATIPFDFKMAMTIMIHKHLGNESFTLNSFRIPIDSKMDFVVYTRSAILPLEEE